MVQFLEVDDLLAFDASIDAAKASHMIDDAEALATLAAPCLASAEGLTVGQVAAIKAILRGAVLRWYESGTGAYQQHSTNTGPFSESVTFDTRQQRRSMFWPSEITQLQNICGGKDSASAFAVDTVSSGGWHDLACSVYFGAPCSCGAVLTAGVPLSEA